MGPNAKLTVTNGAEFKFIGNTNGTSFIQSCDFRWNGIYVDGYSTVDISEAHPFKNSDNGIVSSDEASVKISESDFEDNGRAVYVNSNVLSPTQIINIRNSNFTCEYPLQDGNGNYYWPQKVIEIIGVHAPGGDVTGRTINNNIFSGNAGGIVLNMSSVSITHNDFDGYSNSFSGPNFPGNPQKKDLVIGVEGSTDIYNSEHQVVINDNVFTRTYKSIYINNHITFNVNTNKLNKNRIGNATPRVPGCLFFVSNNNFLPGILNNNNVFNNILSQVGLGISITNSYRTLIQGNQITNVYGELGTGIRYDNSLVPHTVIQALRLENNSISHAVKGIEIINVDAEGYNNSIIEVNSFTPSPFGCLNPPCATIPGFGFKATNSSVDIGTLDVINSHSTTSNDISGVVLENSWLNIRCWRLENLGNGLILDGLNTVYLSHSSTPPYIIVEHLSDIDFVNNNKGFVLNNYGQIVTTLSSHTTAPNNVDMELRWITGTGFSGKHIWCSNNTNGTLSSIYTNTNINPPTINQSDATSSTITIVNETAPFTLDCYEQYLTRKQEIENTVTSNKSNNSGNSKTWLSAFMNRKKNINNSNRLRYESQLALTRALSDTTITDSLEISYLDSLKLLNFGQLIKEFSDTTAARNLSGISANHQFDKDVKLSLRLADKLYKKQILNIAELRKLRTLAWQCPNDYGVAVFQARNILAQLGEYEYFNDCSASGNNQGNGNGNGNSNSNKSITPYVNYQVSPNPSNGYIQIKSENIINSNAQFCLYEITGKLIGCKNIFSGESQYFDTSPIKNGIYFYQIKTESEILQSGKQIIQH